MHSERSGISLAVVTLGSFLPGSRVNLGSLVMQNWQVIPSEGGLGMRRDKRQGGRGEVAYATVPEVGVRGVRSASGCPFPLPRSQGVVICRC